MSLRPLDDRQREWLTAELAFWRERQLVDDATAQRILAEYESTSDTSQRKRSVAQVALMGVAATFVGLALLLIVAYNWDRATRRGQADRGLKQCVGNKRARVLSAVCRRPTRLVRGRVSTRGVVLRRGHRARGRCVSSRRSSARRDLVVGAGRDSDRARARFAAGACADRGTAGDLDRRRDLAFASDTRGSGALGPTTH